VTVHAQDNCNIFLVLHVETTGSLADRAALFSAGCALAAAGHMLLILGYGQSSHTAQVGTAQHPNGREFKTYGNEMAAQYPQASPAAFNAAPAV
jgi:hypothetical protein